MKAGLKWGLAFALALVAGALITVRLAGPSAVEASPQAERLAPPQCSEPCTVNGGTGECVMNVCVRSFGCTRDVDCDDGNACTVERCGEGGACEGGSGEGACTLPDATAGACRSGLCEPLEDQACSSDSECHVATGQCVERACLEGRCRSGARTGEVECSSIAGRPGLCSAGLCVPALAEGARKCVMRWNSYLGWMPECRSGLTFQLEPAELARIQTDLEKRMATNLRYDLKVVLIELVGGGYNIALHNRRPRTDVRGLCDPSFVAFEMAGFTAATRWKSQNLQVWLRPYEEGWSTPTRGSRIAVEQGKASSGLGSLGVVDVRAFRTWLEKAFTPLELDHPRGPVVPDVELAALPARPDAGVVAEAPADAGPKAMSGGQALQKAWEAFGAGRREEALRLNRYARAAGARDPDLDELLR